MELGYNAVEGIPCVEEGLRGGAHLHSRGINRSSSNYSSVMESQSLRQP